MGNCAFNDRNEYYEKTTADDYRAKMLVEYLKGLKDKKKKKEKIYRDQNESEHSETSDGSKELSENSFGDSFSIDEDFEVPEGLNVGEVFEAGDGSRFKLEKITEEPATNILRCLNCSISIMASQVESHSKSEDHINNLD